MCLIPDRAKENCHLQIEYVNPFIESATNILAQIAGISAERGDLGLKSSTHPSHEVATVLGIVGEVKGQVVYSMSQATAKNIASQMMGGLPVEEFDEMAKSAIAELGNMITGNASTLLEQQGTRCNISPPTLITGQEMQISAIKIQTLIVPMNTDCGPLEIAVGLQNV